MGTLKSSRRGAALRAAWGAALVVAASILTGPLAGIAPASAHAELLAATPAAGSTVVEAPKNIVLQFGEDILEMASNIITVIGPDGSQVDNGNTLVNGDTAAVGVEDITDAGTYTVTYRIASKDGHVVTDSYAFEFAPPAGYSPSPDASVFIPPVTQGPPGGGVGAWTTKIFFMVAFAGALWWTSRALRRYRRRALERRPF